jgi:hypothetical protein
MNSKKSIGIAGLLLYTILLCLLAGQSGCRFQDEILNTSPDVQIRFSRDTISFDTLLSTTRSVTRRLTVYNQESRAVQINRIALIGNQPSPFRVLVNGIPAEELSNFRLLGRDSMLLLIEARVPERGANLPFLIEDQLRIVVNGSQRNVALRAWGQDAIFIPASLIQGEQRWEGTRPYVLLGNVLIDSTASLYIGPGTDVRLDLNTSILVQGSLRIEGQADNPVRFGGIRQEEIYREVPGQWGGIFLLEGSRQALVEHAHLRNGSIGFRVGKPDTDTIPDLVVRNSIIENMISAGIAAFTSDIYMENVQVNNCPEVLLFLAAGGHYRFRHCTFANTQTRFLRSGPSCALSNFVVLDNGQALAEPLFFALENSILWGDQNEELQIALRNDTPAQLWFSRNLLKSLRPDWDTENLRNVNPRFRNAFRLDFRPDSLSQARAYGLPLGISQDLRGRLRSNPPDAGAYQF